MAISKAHHSHKSRFPTISKTHKNHKTHNNHKTQKNHKTSSTTLQEVLRNLAMKKVGEKSPRRSGGIEPFLQLSYDEKVDWLRRLRSAEQLLHLKHIEEGTEAYDDISRDDTEDIPTLVLSDSYSSLRVARKALEAGLLLF
jgi:uncharacterized radical SAM superfamily protein